MQWYIKIRTTLKKKRLSMGTLLLSLILFSLTGPIAKAQTVDREKVTATANQVATWQLAHMDNFDEYIRTFVDHTQQPDGWVQAAFYIGLQRWYEATQDPQILKALKQKAESLKWQPGPLGWHADDQAITQLYLSLSDDLNAVNLAPTRQLFDSVIAENADNSLEFIRDTSGVSEGTCQKRWCWSDALFMAPPAWAALTKVTGDSRYLDYALKEYWATTDYLFDPVDHLYYRDSRFFQRTSEHGNKIFWSRGNGWVFAGLPLLLEELPKGHPGAERLKKHFIKMANTFKATQAPSGLWVSSLMDYEFDLPPETSGSAFVVFGLAWGINQGLLSEQEFGPVIEHGWSAIQDRVSAEGKLGWVQQVGYAPDQVFAEDTQLYGTGALLLAASELVRKN